MPAVSTTGSVTIFALDVCVGAHDSSSRGVLVRLVSEPGAIVATV
jgi:hypothetical protein